MQCPNCMSINVTLVGNTHYICNNKNCNRYGKRTQFYVTQDKEVKFPYTQIFKDRQLSEFYKKQYLKIKDVGNTQL